MRHTRTICLALCLTAALVAVAGVPALAEFEDLLLVSAAPDGTIGNAVSHHPSVSADGARVAFASEANNLSPDDGDALWDVYVRDVTTGEVFLASRAANGDKGNGPSYDASLSADGTHVAFVSEATNLDPADGDAVADVYVVELATGAITLASVNAARVKADDDCARPRLDADGSRVAFETVAASLDPREAGSTVIEDVYVKDLDSGELLLASANAAGVKGNFGGLVPTISADGSRVAFYSSSTNLVAADTSSGNDVFVKDLDSGEVILASTSSAGVKGDGGSARPSLSADGSVVAFVSNATNLHPDDTDIFADVYVKDLDTGELLLASVTAAGVKGDRNSGITLDVNAPGVSLSADGGRAAFASEADNLHPDPIGHVDIYVKDLDTGELLLASARADGTEADGASFHPSILADGSGVAFDSAATNLDVEPDPADTHFDVYLKGPPVQETPRLEGDGSGDVRRVAIQVCQLLFPAPDAARTVVLARHDVFADALAGAPLAGDDSCVLYTTGGPDQPLDAITRAEIDRALPAGGPVRILGGTQAVSAQVEAELTGAGYAVERFQGATRFETAVAIARVVRAENPGGSDALLAWGLNFPDAVTGGAYGARTGTPILLTDTAQLHPRPPRRWASWGCSARSCWAATR